MSGKPKTFEEAKKKYYTRSGWSIDTSEAAEKFWLAREQIAIKREAELQAEIDKKDELLQEARDLIDYCASRTIYAHSKQEKCMKYLKEYNLKHIHGRNLFGMN